MLKLTDVVLTEGQAPVSIACPAGQVTAVLGRNFSGKSGLCRMVAGLDVCTHGQVEVDGEDVTREPPSARAVALVVQAFVNYPHWTVAENIASPMRAARLDAGEARVRAAEIAARLGLGELLDRLPEALSGGQQQRLAIARALAKDARVLLLDEPFVNLDYKLREVLRDEISRLARERHLTVLYTTSDPADALAIADHLVLMADGVVLQAGEPMAVYRAPSSVLAADVLSDPGVNRFVHDGVASAVRPEHVRLKEDAQDISLDALIDGFETNGSETFVHAFVCDEPWVLRVPGLHRPEVGGRQPVFVAPADVLQFAEDRSRG